MDFMWKMYINLRDGACQLVEINCEFWSLLDVQKRVHLTNKISGACSLCFNEKIMKIIDIHILMPYLIASTVAGIPIQ